VVAKPLLGRHLAQGGENPRAKGLLRGGSFCNFATARRENRSADGAERDGTTAGDNQPTR